MTIRFWRKLRLRRRSKPTTLEPVPPTPRDIVCKYCGPLEGVLLDEHLKSPEHRLAQARALAPSEIAPVPPHRLGPGELPYEDGGGMHGMDS